jgi:hypothetical protein
MRLSSKGDGAYFCPKKLPDGSYCKSRITGVAPAAQAQTPASGPASGNGAHAVNGDAVLAAGALEFAARVYGSVPSDMHDEVIAYAIKAFSAMKAVCS